MTPQTEIEQFLQLPDEVLEQAYGILFPNDPRFAHDIFAMKEVLSSNAVSMADFNFTNWVACLNFLRGKVTELGKDKQITAKLGLAQYIR